jgi:hypothetical protein
MRRHLPLFAVLLLVAVPALAQDKPVPARPSAAAVVDFRVFRYETIDGWKAAIDLGGLWRPHPESRQSFGGMVAFLSTDGDTSAAVGPAYEADMMYGKKWAWFGGGDVGYIVGNADQYGSGIVDFKTGIRWAGKSFAPRVALAARKTLMEEEGAGEKIDTFGVNFGFEWGK